jgi:hypothetical protein
MDILYVLAGFFTEGKDNYEKGFSRFQELIALEQLISLCIKYSNKNNLAHIQKVSYNFKFVCSVFFCPFICIMFEDNIFHSICTTETEPVILLILQQLQF